MDANRFEKFHNFSQRFVKRKYKKGEILMRGDDNPRGLFYVIKGYLRQYTLSPKGDEFTLHILKPPVYFPLSWVITNADNKYFFEALTSVEAYSIPKTKVLNFLKENPEIMFFLAGEVFNLYEEIVDRIERVILNDAYINVICVFLYIEKHFGEKKGEKSIIHQRFTHKDIATLAGITRETASIEIEKLRKKGFLSYIDHSIVIYNLKKLKTELL